MSISAMKAYGGRGGYSSTHF